MNTLPLVDPQLYSLLEQMDGFSLDAANLVALREVTSPPLPSDIADPSGIEVSERLLPRADGGGEVRVLVVRSAASDRPRASILHVHGGGFVMSSADDFLPVLRHTAYELDCVIVSVDYRLAPETPYPGAIEDCYTALAWLSAQAKELGVDPARIGVMGESAGGGLAAALALLARDRGGPALAFQNLLYPMLDDRTGSAAEPDPNPATGQFIWTRENNRFGWGALLGREPGGGDVSAYAAPAHADSLVGLPPTYLAVGTVDLFFDENLAYARRLVSEGVAVELNVYPGAVHCFDATSADVARRARQQRLDALRRATASAPTVAG